MLNEQNRYVHVTIFSYFWGRGLYMPNIISRIIWNLPKIFKIAVYFLHSYMYMYVSTLIDIYCRFIFCFFLHFFTVMYSSLDTCIVNLIKIICLSHLLTCYTIRLTSNNIPLRDKPSWKIFRIFFATFTVTFSRNLIEQVNYSITSDKTLYGMLIEFTVSSKWSIILS